VKYDSSFKVRCAGDLAAAIRAAATARNIKSSDWLREAAMTALLLDRAAEEQTHAD
jgi:hypothetical protein